MKKLFLSAMFIAVSQLLFGQLNLPDFSPEADVHQHVGYSQFHIRYGRPSARGRKIMDGLVPYKRLWRTGGGRCTMFAFDQSVVINGRSIPAGAYSLATIPDEKEWVVMLNSDTSKIYGDPAEYDIRTEVVRFSVKPEKTSRFYETLTIELDISRGDANVFLAWENTQIHFPIKTGSHERALKEIVTTIERNSKDTEALLMGAWYYYMNNESSDQALVWVNKALSIHEEWWAYEQKMDLEERMKNFSEARKTANTAIAFFKRVKPEHWEGSVAYFEGRLKKLPQS